MVVKGRSVNAFHLSLSVSNYPMKERTKAELEEVQYVSNQRKIEKAECDASKDVVSGPTSARNTPLVGKNKQTIFYVFLTRSVLLTLLILEVYRTRLTYERSKWPCSCCFPKLSVAQLVRAPNQCLGGHGFDSCQDLDFFFVLRS